MAQLTVNESAYGFTNKLAFDYNDLNATGFLSNLGAAGQRVIDTIAPGDIIDAVMLYKVTAAAGNTDSTIDVGNQTNDPDEFLDADAMGNMGTAATFYNTGDSWTTNGKHVGIINSTTAAKTMYMEVNGTLTALTAGSWVLQWRKLKAVTS